MNINKTRTKKILYKIARILGYIWLSFIALFIILALLIQVPYVQNKILSKGTTFLENKLGTIVSIGHVSLKFPKSLSLEEIYLEDQKGDTLLYVETLDVSASMMKLISKTIDLDKVLLKKAVVKISRENDSLFNFDYIIQAFTQPDNIPSDTTSTPWAFSISSVELDNINLQFLDALEHNQVRISWQEFSVDSDEIDFEKQVYHLDDISISGLKGGINQHGGTSNNKPSIESKFPDFSFDEIEIDNTSLAYSSDDILFNMKIDKFNVEANAIALNDQQVDLKQLTLNNSDILFQQISQTKKDSAYIDKQNDTEPWSFLLDNLSLENNNITFLSDTLHASNKELDLNHIRIKQLSAEAEDLVMKPNYWNADIRHFTFREGNGLVLRELKGSFSLTDHELQATDFVAITSASQISLDGKITFKSLNQLVKNAESTLLDITIEDTYLAWSDIIFFSPHMLDSVPLAIPAASKIEVASKISGRLNDLDIETLTIQTIEDTHLALHGNIRGLPQWRQMYFDLTLDKFHLTDGLASVWNDSLMTSLKLPEWIDIRGNARGTIYSPEAQINLFSNVGDINLNGKYESDSVGSDPKYRAKIEVKKLQLGSILNQGDIGETSLEAQVNGEGLKPETMNTSIQAVIKKFEYKNYPYNNFKMNGRLVNSLFTGEASMNDPNLSFHLKGDLDYNYMEQSHPYRFTFKLDQMDFKALHLTERPLRTRLTIDVNLEDIDPHHLNGSLGIRNVAIFNGEQLYTVDSLLLISLTDSTKSEVSINSDFIDGKFAGSFDLLSLPDVLQEYILSFYDPQHNTAVNKLPRQYFNFDLNIRKTPLLTEILVPELHRLDAETIHGEFDSEARKLDIQIKLSKIEYASISLQDLDIAIKGDQSSLNYSVSTEKLNAGIAKIPRLEWAGEVLENTITTSLILYDSLEEKRYEIAGEFTPTNEQSQLHLKETLLLNYENWKMPASNYIQIGSRGLKANQFELRQGQQVLRLVTQADQDSLISLQLDNFHLGNLAGMISSDSLFEGVLSGKVNMYKAKAAGSLEASARISNLVFNQAAIGDVDLDVVRSAASTYDVDLKINGAQTSIKLSGNYKTNDNGSAADLSADISSLNLNILPAITFGQVKEAKGSLSGKLSFTGDLTKPVLKGNIRFSKAEVTPSLLKSTLYINDEEISFSPGQVRFNEFRIKDKQSNTLSVDGGIGLNGFTPQKLDLRIRASKFQILTTTADDNDLFYGNVRLNTTTHITGDISKPFINMQIGLSEGSELTYVVPQSDMGVMERKGIVEFFDQDAQKDPFLAGIEREMKHATDTFSTFRGVVLTANVELDDKETFNIVLNPETDDRLSVKGNATLTLDIDPTGNMNLTGRYEITDGSYNFSFYKLVKREFDIDKGSLIVWSGDPLDASLNISATYKVEAAPINLMASQSTSISTEERNRYKENLPFLVYLKIGGNLLSPEISFELDMPVRYQNALGGTVYAKIQDINSRESELNKQVFALVILKQFVGENPFENQSAVSLGTTARNSVGQVLSQQLNQLSKNIEGIELDFDIKSQQDYSNGEAVNKTDLQLGVSKTLFNDRLVVKLSGNVNLEGEQNQQQRFTDYLGDIALEYKLTEDGRIRITGFRNSDYDMIDGELFETGIGIIYVKDYNSLKELFQFKRKEEDEEE